MRYITVPEDIELYNLGGQRMKDENDADVTLTFPDFVLQRLGDPKFAIDMKAVIAAVEIKLKLGDANGVLALDNDHWERLKAVTEEPSGLTAYHPAVSHNLLPFMKAICDASDTPPSFSPND